MKTKLPKLPQLLDRKIYKTGQTRGADDDVIYQNRVGRNSTVLIPYLFSDMLYYPIGETNFENGYIVLISPETYFNNENIENTLSQKGLTLGLNALVFYETRYGWDKYNPDKRGWMEAKNRIAPLGGNYVARVPATTATNNGTKINRGFNTTSSKGAGIRQYEYSSTENTKKVRLQLESIFWLTYDSLLSVTQNNMNLKDAEIRREMIFQQCQQLDLLDFDRLKKARIIDKDKNAVCPLCSEKISANGFFNRLIQAEGRDIPDLTVTEINLFHIEELRYGVYNHRPYNLGWGHHHCNVVTKDSGILETLKWMQEVLDRNKEKIPN